MGDLGKLIVAKGFKTCPKPKISPNLVTPVTVQNKIANLEEYFGSKKITFCNFFSPKNAFYRFPFDPISLYLTLGRTEKFRKFLRVKISSAKLSCAKTVPEKLIRQWRFLTHLHQRMHLEQSNAKCFLDDRQVGRKISNLVKWSNCKQTSED